MSLKKIYSKTKRKELEAILSASHPNEQERLWLVGFLNHVGYSKDEIINIIHKENRWEDYNPNYTNYKVAAALGSHRSGKRKGGEGVPFSPPRRAKTWFRFMIDPMKFINHCSSGCERCQDLKCVDALRYLNGNSERNRNQVPA